MFVRLDLRHLVIWIFWKNFITQSLDTLNTCFEPIVEYKTGKILRTSGIKHLLHMGPNACYVECQRHGNCLSVNYNRNLFICQLLAEKQTDNLKVEDEKDVIYMETPDITDQSQKKCDDVTCNYYSTCIPTLKNKICIATDCAGSLPILKNGRLAKRLYSPHTAIFECNQGYTWVGSGDTIYCTPGGQWGTLYYTCMAPVHGGYSAWGGWTTCTKTCDTGSKSRSRSCNNPSPQYGGHNCNGNSTETEHCEEQDCPDDNGPGPGK